MYVGDRIKLRNRRTDASEATFDRRSVARGKYHKRLDHVVAVIPYLPGLQVWISVDVISSINTDLTLIKDWMSDLDG